MREPWNKIWLASKQIFHFQILSQRLNLRVASSKENFTNFRLYTEKLDREGKY